jgi:hypothetical protein
MLLCYSSMSELCCCATLACLSYAAVLCCATLVSGGVLDALMQS